VALPAGRVLSVYIGTLDNGGKSGPLLAINAATCAVEWELTGYAHVTGSWGGVAYITNRTSVPLVLFGTSGPDSSVYELNALTGKEVRRSQTYNPSPHDYDVGAGVPISAWGVNGFADGVAYGPNKYGIVCASDFSTGKRTWAPSFNPIAGRHGDARWTAALDGTNLVFGYTGGLFDLNVTNGAVLWSYVERADWEAISSPAIMAASGPESVARGSSRRCLGCREPGSRNPALPATIVVWRHCAGVALASAPVTLDGDMYATAEDGNLSASATYGQPPV
jgi:outer membrane protein assembly factor BamB